MFCGLINVLALVPGAPDSGSNHACHLCFVSHASNMGLHRLCCIGRLRAKQNSCFWGNAPDS